MISEHQADVAVIGGGTAGMVAYRQARKHAERVVLIEGQQFGTTCARVGCMPSKLLIAAADAAHHARHAGQFGIVLHDVGIDGKAVLERVRRERDRFVGGVLKSVERIPASDRLEGMARFEDAHTLRVGDGHRVRAESIVIATGSRTHVPDFLKAAGKRLVTSDDVFEWADLPESVAVFGPGVIGLELGQALARLGVRVRMFGVGGAVGPIRDEEIRQIALETFNEEFPLDPDAEVESIREVDGGVEITFVEQEKKRTESFGYLLAATGRRPNVDGLGLEQTDLSLDDRGVPLFDPWTMQCGDSHIFIAGDANNHLPLLHEAADEGAIAGTNAGRWPEVRVGHRRTPLAVVFSDPQIATAGLTIQQVDERCRGCYEVGSVDFSDQGRSRVMGRTAACCGSMASMAQAVSWVRRCSARPPSTSVTCWPGPRNSGMKVSDMLDMPFYHPVIEEGLRTALRDLNHKLRLGPEMSDRCMECGPGS
jgi:dihydrolipoamide dehydrogenase